MSDLVAPDELEAGVARLAEAWRSYRARLGAAEAP